uniref:hypothetical protein n=1 Tax=Ornithobacterium rhinotracheale TaxID=28251 RepID=UPI0016295738|nr:hypothetical protein [Ornithobacterium rhinotracheale]
MINGKGRKARVHLKKSVAPHIVSTHCPSTETAKSPLSGMRKNTSEWPEPLHEIVLEEF